MNIASPDVLLAKPVKIHCVLKDRETLIGHSNDVFSVGESIIKVIGQIIVNSVALEPAYSNELRKALYLAAYLHDLGKANSQFQRALLPQNLLPQALRHEWISAWLPLRLPELDEWLFHDCTVEVKHAVLFSVLGHHLKLEDGSKLKERVGSGDTSIAVFCNHRDFNSCLHSLSIQLQRREAYTPPLLPQIEIDLLNRPLGELRTWLVSANQWYTKAGRDSRVFVALVKALLIASDVAGSAVPTAGINPAKWAERVMNRVCQLDDLDKVASHALNGRPLREFQSKVADSTNPVVFAKAGCGSGKTIGAYLWAAKRASGRKVFLCYPTTGTATEGFREYVIPTEIRAEAALLHSRAECDLEYISDTPDDVLEEYDRLQSLMVWDIPLIICTVDQILGLVQNSRKSLFSYPPISNGAFIFDEIHQYDDRLFGALLSFLDIFRGSPVLLMTASLPKSRLDAIKDVLNQRQEPLEIIEGPADLETIPRYLIHRPTESPPWAQISGALKEGGKVLWVANTVDRCVHFAKEAVERGIQPLPYHSRYRYCDRFKKHDAVIQSFKTERGVLAVTTQVCEVSLDISADLLVTDLAPVPSLIQRMGRLNRRVTPQEPGYPKPVVLLIPDSEKPYEKNNFENTRKWLDTLGTEPLSQRDLAAAFEDLPEDSTFTRTSAWLDGGPFSPRRTLREADVSIPVILAEDEVRCRDMRGKPVAKEITRYAIPMLLGPVAKEIGRWKQVGFAFVAPSGRVNYSEEWGAKWTARE